MGDVLFFGGIILLVAALAFIIFRLRKVLSKKIVETEIDYKKELMFIGGGVIGFALSTLIFFIGIPLKWQTPMEVGEWLCVIFGSLFMGLFIALFISTFVLHYYKKDLPKKLDHYLYPTMIASFPIIFAFIWVLTEGFAAHMTYPLINGISFNNGIHFTTALSGSPNIAWYALFILGGAILVYFICDHFMYKEFGKHGLLESTFLIAFPAGIIGARIGYVIGNWNIEFANRDFYHVFAIWEGGLTIVSGAVIGIIAGVAWFMYRHKDIPIGKVVNIVVPTILIAQAVGRWGNFFNLEVHGEAVLADTFAWLPSIIRNNLQFSSAPNAPSLEGTGMIYAPLFLIEAIVNFAGYIILYFGVTKGLKKYVRGGDAAFGYVAWYGLTRTFMEPLRYGAFNMGDDGAWSWIWSIIYVAVGIILIVGNHLLWYFVDKKKGKNPQIDENKAKGYVKHSLIGGGIVLGVSLVLIIVGLVLFATNVIPEGSSVIALVPHNIGLIMWIIGLALLTSISIPVVYFIQGRKILKAANA